MSSSVTSRKNFLLINVTKKYLNIDLPYYFLACSLQKFIAKWNNSQFDFVRTIGGAGIKHAVAVAVYSIDVACSSSATPHLWLSAFRMRTVAVICSAPPIASCAASVGVWRHGSDRLILRYINCRQGKQTPNWRDSWKTETGIGSWGSRPSKQVEKGLFLLFRIK